MISFEAEIPIEEQLRPTETLHSTILSKLQARKSASVEHMSQRSGQWKETANRLRMYIDLKSPSKKVDGTVDSNKKDHPFSKSVVVPASYSILHVLLTQLMSIWSSREPMIQIRGRGPEDVTPARMMEQILAYDFDQMNAYQPIYALNQDAVKFGCGIIYDSWATESGEKIIHHPVPPGIQGMIMLQTLGEAAFVSREWGTVKEHNQWTSVDPFKFYPDPRVPIGEPQSGEYIGHRFHRGLMWILERAAPDGPYFNIEALRDLGSGVSSRDNENEDPIGEPGTSSVDEHDMGRFDLDHLQVKLIPREWELGPGDRPEIWWFTVANEAVIIRAHKSPYEHNRFTYGVAEADPDFHSAFNPGLIESIDSLQRYMDWMFNSHLQNLMRHLNDAMIFSPTLIEEGDITNPGPGRHIRLTPVAEELLMSGGHSINQWVQQLPIQDVTSPHLNAVNQMFSLAQRMSAANDPQMGMPTEDKRTLGEIQVITASASQRIATVAKLIDSMAIKPLAERAIQNRMQFTELERYYRIIGDYAHEVPAEFVLAGKNEILGNFDYIPTSGVDQPDPVRLSRTWAQVLQTLAQMGQVMGQSPDGKIPDLNRVAKEVFRTMGAKNIEEFFIDAPPPPQVMPDQAVEQEVQAGNLVPMEG